MKYKFIVLVLWAPIVIVSQLNAQSESGSTSFTANNLSYSAPDIIPPSPEAYNFTKYGNIPVGLFTGTAQYGVPVYTINSGKLAHGISLNYATNGIKVDEIPSRVGLGWTLTVGGTITRNVQGLPDEFSSRTFFSGATTIGTDGSAGDHDPDFWEYVRQAGYATPPDFQPDEYSFNVDGLSGKFIKRENGSFKVLSANGVKISQDGSQKFTLIATDGTKYFFDNIEYTKTLSLTEPIAPENVPGYTATSWHLTKILTHSRDSIVFNYTSFTDTIEYYNGISQENSLYIPADYSYRIGRFNDQQSSGQLATEPLGPACLDAGCLYLSTNIQITGNIGAYLSSITFKGGIVNFITSARDDAPNEIKIDTIKIIRTSDNVLIKCFALSYQYAQYASQTYDTYVSLVNITNSNSFLRKRLYLKEFHDVPKDFSTSNKFTFNYDDYNALPPRLSFSQDHFGYFNGQVNTYFFPNDTWVDNWLGGAGFGGNRSYNYNYAKKGVLTKITYPTGGFTTIEYEPHKVKDLVVLEMHKDSLAAVIDTSTVMNQTVYTDTFYNVAGRQLRLRATCNWASVPAAFFPEGYYAQVSVVNASGDCVAYCGPRSVLPGAEFLIYQMHQDLPSGGPYRVKIRATQAQLRIKATVDKIRFSLDTSSNVGIAGIRVKAVADFPTPGQESNRREFIYGEWDNPSNTSGGGLFLDPENHQFVSAVRKMATQIRDGLAPSGYQYHAGNTILHSNSVRSIYTNENGTVTYAKVIEINHASNNKNNGGTEHAFYTTKSTSAIALRNSPLDKGWNFSPFLADGAPRNNDDILNGQPKTKTIFTYQTKNGSRTILNQVANYFSSDNGYLTIDTFYLVRQIRKRTGVPVIWNAFADYDVNKYWRHYSWVKLDSTIEKSYSNNDSLISKTIYSSYDNQNFKPVVIETTTSVGDTKKLTNKYVTGVNSGYPGYSTYLAMKNANIIDPLLEQKNYASSISADVELSKTRIAFGQISGLYLSSEAYTSQRAASEYLEMTYQQYDSCGNLLQYTGKDGVVTSFIWGYNKQYPVAKIVGKMYGDALSQSSINMSEVNSPLSDNALKTELDKLRTLSGCFVTTYIYDPLIGIKSETDPNGFTRSYEYDNFNRLSVIRDKDNYIIKKITYNFQGQPLQ